MRERRQTDRDRKNETDRQTERQRQRQRQTDRQTDRQADRQTDRQTNRDTDTVTETENSNSKTLVFKDSSVRSSWTYLTASPCYTTNTNKHDYTTNIYDKHK